MPDSLYGSEPFSAKTAPGHIYNPWMYVQFWVVYARAVQSWAEAWNKA